MTPELSASWNELLIRQRGIVRRTQVLANGFSVSALIWQLRKQRWSKVLPGIYATFTGALDEGHRLIVAMLHGGTGAQITGAAALRWHRVRYVPPTTSIEVLVPAKTRRQSADFVKIRRTHRVDPRACVTGALCVVTACRAAADYVRWTAMRDTARAIIAELIQRRLATITEFMAELENGPLQYSSLLRSVVHEISCGVRSAPEATLRVVLESSSVLPSILWNPHLIDAAGNRLPTPDGWITETGIAIEVDSREFHFSPADWQRTMERHNKLMQFGATVLHFTPAQINRDPAAIREIVEQTHATRLQLGSTNAIRVL